MQLSEQNPHPPVLTLAGSSSSGIMTLFLASDLASTFTAALNS